MYLYRVILHSLSAAILPYHDSEASDGRPVHCAYLHLHGLLGAVCEPERGFDLIDRLAPFELFLVRRRLRNGRLVPGCLVLAVTGLSDGLIQ